MNTELSERFVAAKSLLDEHNEGLGGHGQPGFIDPAKFENCIKAAGGTTLDRLKKFSYDDILQCLPAFEGVKPTHLARDLAKIFRGTEGVAEIQHQTNSPRPISSKKADKMTLEELVAAFDPEEITNAVGKRLADISKGHPFIVYSDGRTVNVLATFTLLMELKNGYPPRDVYHVNGEPKEVFVLGDLPDNLVAENPLYPGRPLRPDGTCDQLNRSWEGVSHEVRQFVRVLLDDKVIQSTFDSNQNLLDMALQADALKKLRQRYPTTAVEFDRLKKEGDLPKLLVALKQPVASKGNNRPFDEGRKVNIKPPQTFSPAKMTGMGGHKVDMRYINQYTNIVPRWDESSQCWTENTGFYHKWLPPDHNQ